MITEMTESMTASNSKRHHDLSTDNDHESMYGSPVKKRLDFGECSDTNTSNGLSPSKHTNTTKTKQSELEGASAASVTIPL